MEPLLATARLASLVILGALATCGPAVVDEPPPPTPTPRAVTEAGCFSARDCSNLEICVDPRYPACGAVPACEEGGMILCGCRCVAACTATSCAGDEVCGTGGCCEPRLCTAEAQCGSAGARCVDGRCSRRGTCTLPPP